MYFRCYTLKHFQTKIVCKKKTFIPWKKVTFQRKLYYRKKCNTLFFPQNKLSNFGEATKFFTNLPKKNNCLCEYLNTYSTGIRILKFSLYMWTEFN